MKPQITGFVTRDQAGLRAPRSISHNITPSQGGIAAHYGGGPHKAAEPNSDHSVCIDTWLRWQKYHMNSRGFADIAYTGGYCNHGYAFAGRGAGVRSGANGTNDSNQKFYAVVWIGGSGQTPTELAFNALLWWVKELRDKGGAGLAVKPHNFFKATGCPGTPVQKFIIKIDRAAVIDEPVKPPVTPPVTKPPTSSQVVAIQKLLQVTADGKWGPNTDKVALVMWGAARKTRWWPKSGSTPDNVEQVQKIVGTKVDGIWGPNSQDCMIDWVKSIQTVLRVVSDGLWGVKTDGAFILTRRRYLNNY